MEVMTDKEHGPLRCYECNQPSDRLIRLGEDPDFPHSAVCVCASCITNAFELIHA